MKDELSAEKTKMVSGPAARRAVELGDHWKLVIGPDRVFGSLQMFLIFKDSVDMMVTVKSDALRLAMKRPSGLCLHCGATK